MPRSLRTAPFVLVKRSSLLLGAALLATGSARAGFATLIDGTFADAYAFVAGNTVRFVSCFDAPAQAEEA